MIILTRTHRWHVDFAWYSYWWLATRVADDWSFFFTIGPIHINRIPGRGVVMSQKESDHYSLLLQQQRAAVKSGTVQ